MIVNKEALIAFKNAGNDKKVPALSTIHIDSEGNIISCNAKSVFIVESLSEERKKGIPFPGKGEPVKRSVSIPIKEVEKLVRNIPKDKQFDGLLEMVHVEEGGKPGELQVISHDGKGEKRWKIPEYTNPFIDYKGILEKLYYIKEVKSRFILDRKRLIDTLQTMDKICGDSPSYIEVTDEADLLIRSVNKITGQKVMALVSGVVGDWLEESKFEKSFQNVEEEEEEEEEETSEEDSGEEKPRKKLKKKIKKRVKRKSL